MKVSIVTVSFNSAATIEETIRSVLAQEGVELEYIVLDGASRDGTAEIIARYGSQLTWWASEPDHGQVEALNKGFARATGEVLGFLNADDVLLPGALAKVCERFTANPRAEIVYGGVEWMDVGGCRLGSHFGSISSLAEILDIYSVWWGEQQWVQPEVFVRRSLQARVGRFNERYQLAFDYDFWVRCFLAGAQVERLPAPLVRFRRHAGQKSADRIRANDEIRSILREQLASRPPIGAWKRTLLNAQLGYDTYQLRSVETRPSLAAALVRHPIWLLNPIVWRRLVASLLGKSAHSKTPIES